MNKTRRKQLDDLQNRLQSTGLRDAMDELQSIRDDLDSIKDEEQEAFDNLPESLQEGERGQAMQEAIDRMDDALSTIGDLIDGFDFDQLDEVFSTIDDAKGQA